MIQTIIDNLKDLGPIFLIVWGITIARAVLWPQRYFNSILLMLSIFFTMIFATGFFDGDASGYFLLTVFLIVMLALLLTPALLMINGIVMIRKESFSVPNILSLCLGIAIGVGEVATFIYVLWLAEAISIGDLRPLFMFVSFSVFYFSFLVLSFVVYSIFIQIMPHRMDFDYIIIHGCGLDGGVRLGRVLKNRVDKAIEVYEKCLEKSGRRPVIIPSGGKGDDENLSEAQAMKNYLIGRGIPEEDIVMEDRSTTTRENIIYSKDIILERGGGKRIALVSSNYHIYRCLRLARTNGMKCVGIGSKVARYYWPSALIREFVAVFVTKSFCIPAIIGYLLFVSPIIWLVFSA